MSRTIKSARRTSVSPNGRWAAAVGNHRTYVMRKLVTDFNQRKAGRGRTSSCGPAAWSRDRGDVPLTCGAASSIGSGRWRGALERPKMGRLESDDRTRRLSRCARCKGTKRTQSRLSVIHVQRPFSAPQRTTKVRSVKAASVRKVPNLARPASCTTQLFWRFCGTEVPTSPSHLAAVQARFFASQMQRATYPKAQHIADSAAPATGAI